MVHTWYITALYIYHYTTQIATPLSYNHTAVMLDLQL